MIFYDLWNQISSVPSKSGRLPRFEGFRKSLSLNGDGLFVSGLHRRDNATESRMIRAASTLFLSLTLIATGTFAGDLRFDRVVDGDTVYLSDGVKVRLCGIDAPESRQT